MSENTVGESVVEETVESMEMQDGQDWGDSVDKASGTPTEIPPSAATPLMFLPSGSSTCEEPVPDKLRDLISASGIRLVRCENAWNIEGWAARLKKYLSVTFTIEEQVTSEDILDGFESAGFDVTKVASIQRRISNRSWVVSFTEQEEKDRVLSKGRVKINSTMVFMGDADTRTEIVKIFETLDEMPDTVVIGRLSCFGRILSFRRDVAKATSVLNGVRTARMRIARDIPCAIHVAGEKLSIKYSSQPRSCRHYGGFGHFQGDCKELRCYNCDRSGHHAMDSEGSVLCGVCLKSTHPLSECPFVQFSANVESSYAEAATPRPERTPEQQQAMRAVAEAAAKDKEQREREECKRKKQWEKECAEKERKEKERQEHEEKEREERRLEEERAARREEKRKEDDRRRQQERDEEEAKRRRDEEEDEREERRRREEDRRREDDGDRGRGWDRDRDWSQSRNRHSRERDRDYDWHRDRDDRYCYRDNDRHYRDSSPHYSDESGRRSNRR